MAADDLAGIVSSCNFSLAELDLIDEYEVIVQPRIAGHGRTLFAGLSKHLGLELLDRKQFSTGAVVLRYQPRR